MLLRGGIADHEVGLADVLVRAAVLGIDAQRLVVMLEDEVHVGIRACARVGVEVVVARVVGVGGERLLEDVGGAGPVLALGGGAAFSITGSRSPVTGSPAATPGRRPWRWLSQCSHAHSLLDRNHAANKAATLAFPQAPQTRAEALDALRHADAATRAEAVAWLATRGGMEDAGLLHERLRDESSFVRNYAEQGLWLLEPLGRRGYRPAHGARHRGDAGGRYAEAVSVFTDVIENPGSRRAGTAGRRSTTSLASSTSRSPTATKCWRNPRHFGALSGMGQIHFQLEQWDKALEWYRRALDVNPNMLGVEMNIRLIEEKLPSSSSAGRSA